jgi:hypothetical protein
MTHQLIMARVKVPPEEVGQIRAWNRSPTAGIPGPLVEAAVTVPWYRKHGGARGIGTNMLPIVVVAPPFHLNVPPDVRAAVGAFADL